MTEKGEVTNIIGDYIEIIVDIFMYGEHSKYPKPIKNLLVNRKFKRLLQTLYKFENSGYILTTDNIREYLLSIYNKFPPYGSYRSVESVGMELIEYGKKQITTKIVTDNIICWISIQGEDSMFDITIRQYGQLYTSTYGANISLRKLTSNVSNIDLLLSKVNRKLIEDICHYIRDTISEFRDGKTEEIIEHS